MLQSRFSRLSERLLHAGIAPRHVRRYARELSDHFDDLVREERAAGASRELAETRALSRLGNDDALADAMLSRPELRSLTARYPWAVFGIGPIVLLALSVVGGLYLELWLLNQPSGVFTYLTGQPPGPVTARLATRIYTVYNTLIVYGAPLLFAWLFYWMGSRQRMRPAWIVTGVALICVLGGFQNLIFYDTGCRGCGHLLIQSGLLSPFLHFFAPFNFAEGIARAIMNLTIAGGVWWLSAKRKASHAMVLSHTA
jgi:hypothetical protein